MIDTDARQTIKTLGLFVLWIALMTLAGWYGRGQEPGQYSKLSAQCPLESCQRGILVNSH
jgi:hypothetical protein